MPDLVEGSIVMRFAGTCQVAKYDDWAYYRHQFQSVAGGCRGVDAMAIDGHGRLWLIEVKDYRLHPRTKGGELAMEVAVKVRDSLAGLAGARLRANLAAERGLAATALQANDVRVLLLLAQPTAPSRLRPHVVDAAALTQKLRQLLRAVDPHARVDSSGPSHGVWTLGLP